MPNPQEHRTGSLGANLASLPPFEARPRGRALQRAVIPSAALRLLCRAAARRRRHEFRADGITNRFAQISIDLGLGCGIELPIRHLIDRLQLIGPTRAPQPRSDALVEHPADRQMNDPLAETLLS